MQYSKSGLALTERFEQCRLAAFWDPLGKCWTIAWGRTRGVKEGDTCTLEEADQWALEDTQFAADCVNQHVTVKLDQEQFDAIVDLTYNIGCGAFSGSTLLRDLNAGDFEAAAGQFERWQYAGGKKVAGLLRRRLAEEQEFTSGNPQLPQEQPGQDS